MERADIILAAGLVVTMNQQFDLIPDGAVVVRGDAILAVGPSADILSRYSAETVIDCAGQYILPGLVNAHTHVPMTLVRGLADDLRLDVWLIGYMMPTEREFVDPEFCRLGTLVGCAEMIRSGITTFADMYYYEAEIAAATVQAGMRAVLGQTVLKFPAPDAETFEISLAYCRQFIEDWRDHHLITPTVAPHAPYSNTDETLRRCAELAREFDVPLLTHIAETHSEVEDSIRDTDQRVVAHMDVTGVFQSHVVGAHCVHINEHEMRILKQWNAAVAHCPTANLKLASGIAPIVHVLNQGLTVAIGTDGPASNNDLDMFEEMRLAALLAKTASGDPTALPARQALLMATRHGAQALSLGEVTGSLEPGKRADVMVMDSKTLHNTPHFMRDPDAVYSRIVYAGKASDVRHVLCNGQILMRDRALQTLDEPALLAQAAEYSRQIDEFLIQREGSVLSKLLALTDLEQRESFEVQVKAELPDEALVKLLLEHPDVEILRRVRYRQYDTYFLFDDPDNSRLRFREEYRMNAQDQVELVRSRLTLTLPTKERQFHSTILLSHSRFMADANRPLRFYREYFQPIEERELHKERRRWNIHYQGVLFYVNVDTVSKPELPGMFIELKTRTWSASDAENKSDRIQEMLSILGLESHRAIGTDYLEMQSADGAQS
ncbi:MAG: amidohydrolase [Chloroflexi bacterium]|nr:amidohydrolase [Chloroflexota bacterium]